MTIAEPEIEIEYPESDGAPLGDNTLQVKWIIALHNGFEAHYRTDDNVFVASNLFWYPVDGEPGIVTAPDLMIALGRPKGYRSSYMQWREESIGPQVTFEVLSPSNSETEMERRRRFYEKHGVQEYFLYDPYLDRFDGWKRRSGRLAPISAAENYVSELLGVRFQANDGEELRVYGRDGARFLTHLELVEQNERDQELKIAAERQRDEAARQAAQSEREAAEATRHAAQSAREAAEAIRQADYFKAKLRELGFDPESPQRSVEPQ